MQGCCYSVTLRHTLIIILSRLRASVHRLVTATVVVTVGCCNGDGHIAILCGTYASRTDGCRCTPAMLR